jgi:hypothetical protein
VTRTETPDVVVPDAFAKVAKKKEKRLRQAIARCVQLLGDDPRHPGLRTHRVSGRPGVWEAYVDRANRVTFHWDDAGRVVLRKNCGHDILARP